MFIFSDHQRQSAVFSASHGLERIEKFCLSGRSAESTWMLVAFSAVHMSRNLRSAAKELMACHAAYKKEGEFSPALLAA